MKEEEKEIELKVNWNQVLGEVNKVCNEIKSQNQHPRLNILILGKTGVGKSTLINTVFGKDFTKTGQGTPVTQEIESFTDNEKLFIYDSPGLELDEGKKVQIENFIKEQEAKAADEQIHIAWLCISEAGRRIEETEKALYRLLKSYRIPILAVITKAQQDKDEKGERFSDVVKKELETDEVFRVRALEIEDDDGEKKKIMGIKELINKSYILLPDGRKEAFARKQKYDEQMRKEQCVKDAKSLIDYYSAAAAVPCASPLPLSDIALILPIQIAMILHISKTYGLEFNEESAKKVALALLGVCGAGFGIRAVVGTLIKFIPGIGSIAGMCINGTIATTTTKAMGELYLAWLNDNFENIIDDMVDFNNIDFGQYEYLIKDMLKS